MRTTVHKVTSDAESTGVYCLRRYNLWGRISLFHHVTPFSRVVHYGQAGFLNGTTEVAAYP